ncbi:MAG: FKBP-type peptidyl-prolyl cis-trans isomerase [Bacteroidales bacterium]|nr:FKBP-type peptidyl-prolyl cis-trans isomerase [Bacteroidales bacterium]
MAQRFIKLAYRMFTASPDRQLLYETDASRPVAFVTDMGLMIDAFEQQLSALNDGDEFDFTLQAAEAFGERDETLVRAVPRKMFEVNGKFMEEEIYPGAQVPLMDNEGNHFYGIIAKVTNTDVTVDLNNPLAGKALQFTGTVYENREATLKEIEQTAKMLSGEGGCGCGGCGGGGCEGGGCGEGCEGGGCGGGGCCDA